MSISHRVKPTLYLLLVSSHKQANGRLILIWTSPQLNKNHSAYKLKSSFMGSIDKSSGAAEVVTIDVHQAKYLLDSGNCSYLDVRTVEEYKKGHVDTAKILNIPIMFNTPEGRVKNPDFLKEVECFCKHDHHLIVGCQSGVRSVYATTDLLTAGFKDVSNMGGGYLAWMQAGFQVKVDDKTEEKPKEKSECRAEL